jgi:acetolactate synthase-1/2/3 large subunit
MLRYDFTQHGDQPVGTELDPPDFVALATAFGVAAEEVTVDGLTAALRRHLATAAPSLLVLKARYTPPPNSSPNWYRAKQP